MKTLAGIGLLWLALGVMSGTANAAAWCAVYDVSTRNCGFHTYQQCLATIQGIGGYCVPNSYEDRGQRRRYR
jgi:hypothetical protein